MSSEDKDVPQNTQDLTVFVQNLLQQMVRQPRPRATRRPCARRGCADRLALAELARALRCAGRLIAGDGDAERSWDAKPGC